MLTRTGLHVALAVDRTGARLQQQVGAGAAGKFALRSNVTSHGFSPYTRRRLAGRQPLCGIVVTSLMLVIFKPAALSSRTADSRPGTCALPRPLMSFTRSEDSRGGIVLGKTS